MSYESIDQLQKLLADGVFSYASDRKKAAGRALGTLVELVTYYVLCAWNLRDHIVIERSVPEFANDDIVHNVEFSLHPVRARYNIRFDAPYVPLSTAKIKRKLPAIDGVSFRNEQVLKSNGLRRNSAVIAKTSESVIVADIDNARLDHCVTTICDLGIQPFAIVECKRVGVEEGMTKGPQTIEKAKQGAYVSRSVSSMQKIRRRNGQLYGVIERADGQFDTGPYAELLRSIIECGTAEELDNFILTVGVVSNHGNWFTAGDQNKELKVLAQSYDWLLFLTDEGLCEFIGTALLGRGPEFEPVRRAFQASYPRGSGPNRFTKVNIDLAADQVLQQYFRDIGNDIDTWFNVISPEDALLPELRTDLGKLALRTHPNSKDAAI